MTQLSRDWAILLVLMFAVIGLCYACAPDGTATMTVHDFDVTL